MRPVVLVWACAAAGCGPSDVCRDWVACQRVIDPSVDVAPWDDGGSCWSTPRTAAACSEQCDDALDALRALPGVPAACAAPAETSTGTSGAADADG